MLDVVGLGFRRRWTPSTSQVGFLRRRGRLFRRRYVHMFVIIAVVLLQPPRSSHHIAGAAFVDVVISVFVSILFT